MTFFLPFPFSVLIESVRKNHLEHGEDGRDSNEPVLRQLGRIHGRENSDHPVTEKDKAYHGRLEGFASVHHGGCWGVSECCLVLILSSGQILIFPGIGNFGWWFPVGRLVSWFLWTKKNDDVIKWRKQIICMVPDWIVRHSVNHLQINWKSKHNWIRVLQTRNRRGPLQVPIP